MTMMQGLSLTGVSVSTTAKKRGELSLATTLSHVKALHQLLAEIYDGLETDGLYDDDFDEEIIPSGQTDAPRLVEMFADRCFKLVTIMSGPTQGSVELPVTEILTALSRGLAVTYSHVLSVPSRSELSSLLPWLHQCCMDVLSQLILCCGRDILPQSHVIIDLCLQTIVSTAKMTSDARFRTRSSVYQALVLWVRSCGWGRYLTSHRKLLLQELMADIQPDASDTFTQTTDGKTQDVTTTGGKKKNKKKRKHRGDSYLELEKTEDENKQPETSVDRLDVVGWALSLSQLTVENIPFSTSQSLVHHLVQTVMTVQRLSQSRPEPYKHESARENLYSTLASCLLSRLDVGCNRNDAVGHYQLTNCVTELLHKASHSDDWKIAKVCSQALGGLKMASSLNGPVIRKVLEFDDSSTEDVGQLMREKEQMQDTVDDLRQKLLKSEMESEQQSRLVSSLREEMERIKIQLSSASVTSQSQDERMSDDDEEEDVNDDDVDENDTKTNGEDGGDKKGNRTDDKQSLAEVRQAKKDVGGDFGKRSNGKSRVDSLGKDDGKRTGSRLSSSMDSVTRHKRTNEDESGEKKESKKAKFDVKEKNDDNNIDEMLLDFVDAPPDS